MNTSLILRTLRLFGLLTGLGFAAGQAQVTITSYTQTGSLAANDDDYSGAVDLGFSINFGGSTRTQTYVSNNGYITFGSGSYHYTPVAFDANYGSSESPGLPIIAAFFSDVDTRDPQSGLVTWGTGLVDGRAAFVAKWNNVGEFGQGEQQPFKANSFSLVVVSRTDVASGDFDVYLNYTALNWDHGGATAGFHNGSTQDPLYYQVPGSLTAGAFLSGAAHDLVLASNTGAAGNILFQARGGTFLQVAPIAAIPEPSTYALLALGAGLLGLAARRRRA